MPIEFSCQNCQKTLRVPSEFGGRKARCPNCQSVNVIIDPAAQAGDAASQIDSVADPAAGSSPSFPQSNPGLGNVSASPSGEMDTTHEPYQPTQQGTSSNPFSSPVYSAANPAHQNHSRNPHRGGLILTLGILSIVCNVCLVPGILAVIFGWTDLKKMDHGQMDREGHGLTMAGLIMGSIMTVLALLVVAFYVFIALIVAVA